MLTPQRRCIRKVEIVLAGFDRVQDRRRVALARNTACGASMRLSTISLNRYRDLRRRLHALESLYDDQATLDRIIESGRFIKLAVTTARAYEQIEKEFGAVNAVKVVRDADGGCLEPGGSL
jgi:hypothetical protein